MRVTRLLLRVGDEARTREREREEVVIAFQGCLLVHILYIYDILEIISNDFLRCVYVVCTQVDARLR